MSSPPNPARLPFIHTHEFQTWALVQQENHRRVMELVRMVEKATGEKYPASRKATDYTRWWKRLAARYSCPIPSDGFDLEAVAMWIVEHATAKGRGRRPKRRRRAAHRKPVALTDKQVEAMQLVAEHKGNVSAAARAAGKSHTAMRKLYNKASKKLGTRAVKHYTQRLPSDRRGQATVAARRDEE